MLFLSRQSAFEALHAQWRWPHFTISELSCHCRGRFCGGAYWHDPAFLDGLEAVRHVCGRPLQINSGHRCDQWNAAVGGAPLSQHKRLAVDIGLHGHDRHALLAAAKGLGFRGFGLAKTFLHVDRRGRPALWFYGGSKDLWQI